MLADASFGRWRGRRRRLPDCVAISEPDRDYTFAEFEDRDAPGIF
jgi:3-oxocholest-4-en-26-oate---CoA ligase